MKITRIGTTGVIYSIAILFMLVIVAVSIYTIYSYINLSPYNDVFTESSKISVSTDKGIYDLGADLLIIITTENHTDQRYPFDRCLSLEVEKNGKWYIVPNDRIFFLDYEYLHPGEKQVEHLFFSDLNVSKVSGKKCRIIKKVDESIYVSNVFYVE